MSDKFSAIWVSHTSISDFLQCPRAYYLKHMYRDPKTGHKIKVMSPPLALGQAVHEVIETLSILPAASRFSESLVLKFNDLWPKVSGKKGGFTNPDVEAVYKNKGEAMLLRIMKNPGPLVNPAVKIREPLPHYWLSEEKNIILCGKVDWLEYIASSDSVHIIDFKTSKAEEKEESMQLPIYHLLVHNTQKRPVSKASYWYLQLHDDLVPKELPDLEEAYDKVLEVALQIKTARQLNKFACPQPNGCYACKQMEAIIRGEGEYVGVDEYNADVYIASGSESTEEDSYII